MKSEITVLENMMKDRSIPISKQRVCFIFVLPIMQCVT